MFHWFYPWDTPPSREDLWFVNIFSMTNKNGDIMHHRSGNGLQNISIGREKTQMKKKMSILIFTYSIRAREEEEEQMRKEEENI